MIEALKDEAPEVRAYQRGWHDAGNWREPHLNPYPAFTPEWLAYAHGSDDRWAGNQTSGLGVLTRPQAH